MQNFYIYFLTNLTLLLIAAKLWGKVEMGWLWVLSPLIAMTIVGILAAMGGYFKANRMRSDVKGTLDSLRNLIEQAKKKEESAERTIN